MKKDRKGNSDSESYSEFQKANPNLKGFRSVSFQYGMLVAFESDLPEIIAWAKSRGLQ